MISVPNLVEQVKNATPYLFNSREEDLPSFVALLREWSRSENADRCSLTDFFKICYSAHHATVSSFVPTDVDHLIRWKLWKLLSNPEARVRLAQYILESRTWDFRTLSARWIQSPFSNRILSGHQGEWFSVAAAAYASLRKFDDSSSRRTSALVLETIFEEWMTHFQIFGEIQDSGDGISAIKAIALIAHNLGDLDRVIDLWSLPDDDPLRMRVYDFENQPEVSPYKKIAELNRQFVGPENHRHFALRSPRCLRKQIDFLLPLGPFFDDWGRRLARHPDLNERELAEVVTALVDGWEKLNNSVGYSRALAGILETCKGGASSLAQELPARVCRVLKSGRLRLQCSISQERFERLWRQRGLIFGRVGARGLTAFSREAVLAVNPNQLENPLAFE